MASPQDIPLYANDQVVDFTWAESGAATEPTTARKSTGLVAGDTPPADDWNWPDKVAAQFGRAQFARYPKASEGLFTSWMVQNGNGIWANGINPLEGFLSDAGGVNSLVADVWLNPPSTDTGAVRVQVAVSKASPQTFAASRDTYVFVPIDLIAPPIATTSDMTFTDVGLGSPAPATPAGTVAVWKVTTDASSITAQEVLVPAVPSIKQINVDDLSIVDDLVVGDALTVGGNADVAGNVTIDGTTEMTDSLTITGTGTVLEVTGGSGADPATSISTTAAGAPALFVRNTGGGLGLEVAQGGASVTGTMTCVNALVVNGNATIGDAGTDTHTVNGNVTCNHDLTVNGSTILGDAGADTLTINALVTSTIAQNTSSASPAYTLVNSGAGIGLSATVAGNYAGYFAGDASSPAKASVFLLPQDADPSSPVQGDLLHHSGRGKLRQRGLSAYESVHSSTKGFVRAATMDADFLAHSGTTGNICSCTILPEETGSVVLVATVFWNPAADTTTMDVIIRDNTAASDIVTREIRAKDVDASGNRGETVTLRVVYSLPSAASREFVLILFPNATVDLYNPVLTVDGVY